jgi:hypothetical protein
MFYIRNDNNIITVIIIIHTVLRGVCRADHMVPGPRAHTLETHTSYDYTRLIAADPSGESRRISIKKKKTKQNKTKRNEKTKEKKNTKTGARVRVQRRFVRIPASTFRGLTARR